MRACEPDREGRVERNGVGIHFEVFGSGDPTFLLLPTWSIAHSRTWKMQVAYLARHHRVVTFDGRGNGLSDRPSGAAAYAPSEFVADALTVMDSSGTAAAVVVGWSLGGMWAAQLAAEHPERVRALVLVGAVLPLSAAPLLEALRHFEDTDDGSDATQFTRQHWEHDYRDFAEYWMAAVHSEPHSTKAHEDGIGYALETSGATLVDTMAGLAAQMAASNDETVIEATRALCAAVSCPVLLVHGTADLLVPHGWSAAAAAAMGGSLLTIEAGGHAPHARQPVRFNLALRDVAQSLGPAAPAQRRWRRAMSRPRQVLYLSSPIGLGHAQRDLAIASELRAMRPDVEIVWLSQHPVTAVLEAAGEQVHAASSLLASESGHVEGEAGEHDLHCFQALRRMDEILVANFMVFTDLCGEEQFDLVVADEAWEVDHFLHENPELKRSALCWLTDFVGFLPMPDGGEREALVATDYNAEMVEHVARFPRLRDRAVFVGNPEDIIDAPLGPGLPLIRDWTAAHFDFCGYATGFEPVLDAAHRSELRHELGYRDGERVCIVSVGGTAVGTSLLLRVIAAASEVRRHADDLRFIVVAGPRIDPRAIPAPPGVEVHGFVPNLQRHFAACDVAVVQGGLSSCMELTAHRRPFLYFPLRHHFEQTFHVRHRLDRYRAGRWMDYETTTPEVLAAALVEELGRPLDYRPVETDGAARAAALLAELL